MISIRTLVLALVAALGAANIVGCASTDTRRSTGQAIDDTSITARVKTALAKEEGLGKAMEVNVTTNRGVVQLSGFVDSQTLVNRAGQVARNVEGVQSVRNDLRVASAETRRPVGQAVDDATITARVKTALAKDTGIGNAMDINVTTNRGTVQLSGFVDSSQVANRAGQVARNVEGVQSVRNDLQIASRSSGAGVGSSRQPGY